MARSGARRRSRWNACRRCARRFIRILPPASVLPTLLIGHAWAAEFQARPILSAAQYYSDNIRLAPRGQEQSDWVTQVSPGLTLNYTGAKLKFFATATAEMLYRLNEGSFDVKPQWNGGTVGSMEVVDQFLYVETNSTVAQYDTSLSGPLAGNNINDTGNRSTVRTTRLSPFIRYNFGGEATGELRYVYSIVTSDAPGTTFSDSESNGVLARVTSGPAYKATTWNVTYRNEAIDYSSNQPDNTLESIIAGGQHLLTPFFGLTGSVGYENNEYPTATGDPPKGSSWNVGFIWTPTPRTSLAATTGRRFFGDTHSLDFSHRTRLTFWSAGYSEEVTTTRSQFLVPTQASTASILDSLLQSRIPDPVARQQAVQQEINRSGLPSTLIVPVNFLANQVFLEKAWRASAGLQGARHTILGNIYTSTREAQTAVPGAGDFSSGSVIDQAGASVSWAWSITPITTSIFSVSYRRDEQGTGSDDATKLVRLSLNTQLGPKTTGSVSYQRQQNDAGIGYSENQIAARLQMRF